jgi:hypothetical protein
MVGRSQLIEREERLTMLQCHSTLVLLCLSTIIIIPFLRCLSPILSSSLSLYLASHLSLSPSHKYTLLFNLVPAPFFAPWLIPLMLPETEFLNGIFSRVFWALTRVFSDKIFCLVFYPHFSVLQTAIHEYTWIFLFRGFFVKIFKPEKNMVFFL